MQLDLTQGAITKRLLLFAFPLMIGNLLQQFYNIADTLIVGRVLGTDALAAVGSSYTLMVFLTSIVLGLCMGSSAYFSILYGKKAIDELKNSFYLAFLFIGCITLVVNVIVYIFIDEIMLLLQIPSEIYMLMKAYLLWIFVGMSATFLYNYFANLLRAVGNSFVPLVFLAISAILNIVLDLLFVIVFSWGVEGAAIATVISQYVSGIGIMIYYMVFMTEFHIEKKHRCWNKGIMRKLCSFSLYTCLQQSVMNLGILAVQGLVNRFGTVIMAAFAAGVKIDSFAYMPVQDFGNAFSTFIAQNYGAGRKERIQKGIRSSLLSVFLFTTLVSILVCIFAKELIGIFIDAKETVIIAAGVQYLRIEASFYFGIGLLFLLYGYYRAIELPQMSVILTVLSLGTRVLLAYVLSASALGVSGIWLAVPIGWALADIYGVSYYWRKCKNK